MTKLSDGTVVSHAYHPNLVETHHGFDYLKRFEALKVGTIVAVRNVDSTDGLQQSATVNEDDMSGTPYETVYDVRIDSHNAHPFIFTNCRALKPFFGATNFFDMIHEAANNAEGYSDDLAFSTSAESLIGSRCVILCLEKNVSAPIIMGFLQHPARPSTITEDMGLHMVFEFNGMNFSIDKDGAFTLTANGPYETPIAAPIGPVPDNAILQDPTIGPFTFQITADMQLMIEDNLGQGFRIDRVEGEIEITNGSESILISQDEMSMDISVGQKFSIDATDGDFNFDNELDISVGQISVDADTKMEFSCADLSITSDGKAEFDGASIAFSADTTFEVDCATMSFTGATGELLDILNELITALGGITVASPVGPCAPIMGAPQWAQVQEQLVLLQGLMG